VPAVIGVPKETEEGERRVALVPEGVARLAGNMVFVESKAGQAAGFEDSHYETKGATIASGEDSLYERAEVVLKVKPPTRREAKLVREGAVVISFLYPAANLEAVRSLSERKATVFAMELVPRISRAQSMDALSTQATISGYKAVLLAADALPNLFPMLMTAAGTIAPAKVFVLGAGVAGLQAIATARRLGAVVEAYDVRPAAKEQVESLGARFVELPLEAEEAQTAAGYAKAQSEEFYARQQALLTEHVRASDVIITTALVPGKRAPILVTEEAVKGMKPGSVVVDLAAEQGGNCACTEPGKTVIKYGVNVQGPLNLPSSMAPQASQLYSRNVTSFLRTMLKDGILKVDTGDEVIRGAMVLLDGVPVNPQTKAALEGSTP
jgi:proton-translocating NAD(P)+ transhydrogenase subunit alpha